MKILGIETATEVCAVAITNNGNLLVERRIETPHVHSEKLISLIDECLHIDKSELQALDGIAISIGPGSFTGLRIGLSVAKGLAYSSCKPLVSVPTLEALAQHAVRQNAVQNGEIILPMIDARRDDVYLAMYRYVGEKFEEVNPSCAISVHEIRRLNTGEQRIIVLGNGAEKFHQFLQKTDFDKLYHYIFLPRESCLCSAVSVAMLGNYKLSSGMKNNIASLEPMYVKDFYTLLKTQHHEAR